MRRTLLFALAAAAAGTVTVVLLKEGRERGSEVLPTRRQVIIQGMRFEPAELTVAAGDTVEWVNRDLVPHTATARSREWDSGDLPPDATWAVVVSGRGVQAYSCLYHAGMKGSVVVP